MVFVADLRKHINIFLVILILAGILLFFQRYNLVLVDVNEDIATIRINFLIPMNQFGMEKNIKIKSFTPNSNFQCDLKWESSNVLKVKLKEIGNLKGQKVFFTIKGAKSSIPIFHKSASVAIQFQAEPKLLKIENENNIPTEGPLILQFNTPMDPKNINKYIQSDIEFELKPEKIESRGNYIDYSRWNLYPKERMKNEANYLILLKKGMKSQCGYATKEDFKKQIRTTSKPKIIKTTPKQSGLWIALYPRITAQADEELSQAIVTIDGVQQKVKVKEDKLEFLPHTILDPEQEYEISIQGVSKHGEKTDPYILKFTTMPLEDDIVWVEVVLKEKHEVFIHKGKKIIRRMPASGGRPDQPTLLGTFYIQDRGPNFFSERFNEGATYWVRFLDQYLFHGIPRDKRWNIIDSELRKIGKPASHGCIRFLEEDAKWFYENIPQGTMVIIHE